MGSFIGHALAGTVALLVGFWNLRSAIRSYLAAPHAYVARAWHPVPISGHWVRLPVYVIIGGALLQLIEGLFLGLMSAITHQLDIIQFEHATMFAVLVIMGLIFYVNDSTSLLPLPQGSLHILYAISFFTESLLTTFHSIAHEGLEPRYHILQAMAAFACFLLALLVAAFPSCFLLDVLFNAGILFQGLWLWTMSWTLYGVLHLPGCRNVDYKMVKCATEEQEHLGIALSTLQFVVALVFTMLFVLSLYSRAARRAPRSSLEFILASTQPRSKGLHGGYALPEAASMGFADEQLQGGGVSDLQLVDARHASASVVAATEALVMASAAALPAHAAETYSSLGTKDSHEVNVGSETVGLFEEQ